MPTALRFGKIRVVVYPNDHRPAHVHLIGPGSEAVFNLQCPTGPAELRDSMGFATQELNWYAACLQARLPMLCETWTTIHGHH